MDKLKIVLLTLGLALSFMANAQKPGYQSYSRDSVISPNGNRSNSSGTVWVKFGGDLIFINYGLPYESRYKYHETQANGVEVYYFQAYNHGTMAQGSGWMTFYDECIKISPDKNTLNQCHKDGSITVYKIHTPSSAGDMIY